MTETATERWDQPVDGLASLVTTSSDNSIAALACHRVVRMTRQVQRRPPPVAVAPDKCLGHPKGFVIRELVRRMFAEVGGRASQRATLTPFHCEPGTAHGVDGYAGGVGRVLNRKAKLQVHRNVPEQLSLHPNEADLVVLLPRYIVTRTDMDIFPIEPFAGYPIERLLFWRPSWTGVDDGLTYSENRYCRRCSADRSAPASPRTAERDPSEPCV